MKDERSVVETTENNNDETILSSESTEEQETTVQETTEAETTTPETTAQNETEQESKEHRSSSSDSHSHSNSGGSSVIGRGLDFNKRRVSTKTVTETVVNTPVSSDAPKTVKGVSRRTTPKTGENNASLIFVAAIVLTALYAFEKLKSRFTK